MITPEPGKVYVIKHSSGFIRAKFSHETEGGFKLARTRYHFRNLSTGREIVLKSRMKIKREWVNLTSVVGG